MDEKYQYVKNELVRRQAYRQLEIVAEKSGVGRRTIGYILKEGRDVKTSTLNKLHGYLKANEKQRDL